LRFPSQKTDEAYSLFPPSTNTIDKRDGSIKRSTSTFRWINLRNTKPSDELVFLNKESQLTTIAPDKIQGDIIFSNLHKDIERIPLYK
jgi:hypothetical protein